jgi:hypothetical protein
MKHFTYKITFPGMPWFYFGVHTENGKPYYGSPKTHAWRWKTYDHEIQILEWFETRKEAEQVEDRIIKLFLDNPDCLNEHYGGHFSEGAQLRGVQTQKEKRVGLFDPANRFDPSIAGKVGGLIAGRKTYELGIGVHAPGVAQQGGLIGGRTSAELGHLQRNAREYGLKGGPVSFEKKVGIHDPDYRTSEQYRQTRVEAGRKSGSYRYKCNLTGYEGVRVNVVRHQKKLGIDPIPENRTLL